MEKNYYTRTAVALSGLSSALMLVGPALAQTSVSSYTDVSPGAWYESAADNLLDIGALDPTETRLRPNDLATRAEMVKLLVRVNDEQLIYPARSSFTDVSKTAWHFPYFESSARLGWVKGDKNCYGTMPCYARPANNLNRAEAAALLVRAFALPSTGAAPVFMDNRNSGQWYYQLIQTAADHCILQGDDTTNLVRPASNMNRAEMIVMFDRAYQHMEYGTDCGTMTSNASITSASAVGDRVIRLGFSENINSSVANELARYGVRIVGGATLSVTDVDVTGPRTVDLTVGTDLNSANTYIVSATNMKTSANAVFSSSRPFTITSNNPLITSAVAETSSRIRVQFSTDVENGIANDAFRYTVRENGGTAALTVQSATVVNSRTVDLIVATNARAGVQYVVNVKDMESTTGVIFSDDATFVFNEQAANLDSVTASSQTAFRLTFTPALDRLTAENANAYRVTSNGRDIPVSSVALTSSGVVLLTVGEALQSQRTYVITATGLKTTGGVSFNDSGSTVYTGTNVTFTATLNGAKEVPSVVSVMTGTGTFTLTANGLQYSIQLSNTGGLTISGAHFHRGAVGISGPVITPITVVGKMATGTWANLTEQDRNDLLNGNVYVNIHTTQHPDGEIRGQVTVQ
jgi:CHRD domain/S-layer homology domain